MRGDAVTCLDVHPGFLIICDVISEPCAVQLQPACFDIGRLNWICLAIISNHLMTQLIIDYRVYWSSMSYMACNGFNDAAVARRPDAGEPQHSVNGCDDQLDGGQ